MKKPQKISQMELWAWVYYNDYDKRMDFLSTSHGIAVYRSEEQARRQLRFADDASLVRFTAEFIARGDEGDLEVRDDN